MPCYKPLKGYRSKTVSSNGKRAIVFSHNDGYIDMPVQVPCGQCIGCRLERSRQWAIRCLHEASLYEENSFITLTYADEHLPEDLSVDVREFQLFMKRLRKQSAQKIRFYHCGEYGEKYGRPHYHAILFNKDFADKELINERDGNKLYKSKTLEMLWPYGYSSIGDVTFQSAAYVARYLMKKVTGEGAANHYQWIDPSSGEIHQRKPEYTTMSRRPGIGKEWLQKFSSDTYSWDQVIINGKPVKPPKYYDRQFELETPEQYSKVRAKRIVKAKQHGENNTKPRLRVREKVQQARLKNLPRNLDKEI